MELRFWTHPAASPANLRALITTALATIAGPQPETASPGGPDPAAGAGMPPPG